MNSSNRTILHRLTIAVSVAVLTGSLSANPASAAGTVPYKGTEKADKPDFRQSGKNYDIKTLGGNDRVYSGFGNDTIDAGKGSDTIDPSFGNDVVRGGPGRDYFRYRVGDSDSAYYYATDADTICDFDGDKIDVYNNNVGVSDEVVYDIRGGNFAWFDTNKDGLIDKKDKYSLLKTVKTCGPAKESLVLDAGKAFGLTPGENVDGLPGTLTIYGKTSLKKSDFVKDYYRDHPY